MSDTKSHPIFATARRLDRTRTGYAFRDRGADGPVELLIYDEIGGPSWFSPGGVVAADFARELADIPRDRDILVSINSPGGNVDDGIAIYNRLVERGDKVTVRIDGIAASIAGVIAMAGNRVEMPENAAIMVHNPWSIAEGNAEDLRRRAEVLDHARDRMVTIYKAKTGLPESRIRKLMDAETWINGAEAKDLGFADATTAPEASIAASIARFDLTRFARVPETIGQANTPPTALAAPGRAQGAPPNHNDTMNRKKALALLTKHGRQIDANAPESAIRAALCQLVTDGTVTQAEVDTILATTAPEPVAQPATAPAPNREPEPNPEVIALRRDLDRASAALDAERRIRITARFETLAATRPFLADNRERLLTAAITDETRLEDFAGYAENTPREPLEVGARGQNLGNLAVERYRNLRPGAERRDFRIEAFSDLRRHLQPRAANTVSSSLLPDWLADGLIVVAHNKLASLRAFSRDFSLNTMAPKATVQVRKATAGATAQTNATNFESGDSTLAATSVTVNQKTVSFHITNAELNSGHKLADLAEINAHQFSDAISDVMTALMIAGNYGAATTIGAASAFDSADLPAIMALAKNYRRKHLLLDGGHLAYLLPTDRDKFRIGEAGAYGFDGIFEQNRWTGATTNAAGFVTGPDAIAVAAGMPVDLPAGQFLSLNNVTLEDIGLTVMTASWFNTAGRVHWASYDVMFGAAAADTTQAEVLVTA